MADLGTRVVQVPFSSGVNTGADKRAVNAPMLTWGQNVVLDTDGILRKRKGYVSISNDDPRTSVTFNRCDAMAAYDGGLVAIAGEGHLWHRVSTPDDLIMAEWGFAPVCRVVGRQAIARSQDTFGVPRVDIAYESTTSTLAATYMVAATTSKAAVFDADTGHVRWMEGIKTNVQRVRLVNVGTRIYYIQPSSNSANINMFYLDCAVLQNMNTHANGGTPQFTDYDFATGAVGVSTFSATEFFFAYSRGTSVFVAKCGLFGTAVASVSIGENVGGPIACRYIGSLLWVAWQVSGSGDIRMAAYDSSCVQQVAPFTVLAGAAQAFTLQIGARDGSSVLLAWDNGTTCRVRAVQTNGTLLLTERSWVADHIESAFFEVDGRSFLLMAEPSNLQGGTYLIDVTTTSGNTFVSNVSSAAVGHLVTGALSTATPGDTVSSVVQRSDGAYLCAVIVKPKITLAGGGLFAYASAILGTDLFEFDLTTGKRFRSAEHGGQLVMAGGVGTVFDGREVNDIGFLRFPEAPTSGGTLNTGGNMVPGVYQYVITYRRDDLRGRIWRSNPSLPLSVTVPAGTNTNRVIVNWLNLNFCRQSSGSDAALRAEVWRTVVDSPGPFYLVGSVANSPTSSSAAGLTDGLADASINVGEVLYTDGGVLANFPPPASTFMVSHGEVLICDNAEDGSLWQSKPLVVGEGFAFSEALTYRIASSEKPVMGASMDDKCIIFTENEIHMLVGQPRDDKGGGAGFQAQRLSSPVGCIDPRSVVVGKDGCYFRSRRGIELLTRSLDVVFAGFDVTYWTDNYSDTLFAGVASDQSEVRFCVGTPAGGISETHQILRLNYERRSESNPFGQWTTELVGMGAPSAGVMAGGSAYLGYTNGTLFKESPTLFTDNGTFSPMKVRMMLKPAGQQGFVRLRHVGILGERKSTHALTVNLRYNYSDATDETRQWTNAEIAALPFIPREQLDVHVGAQKAQAYEVEIVDADDTVGGGATTGEGVWLSALALELAVRERTWGRALPDAAKK